MSELLSYVFTIGKYYCNQTDTAKSSKEAFRFDSELTNKKWWSLSEWNIHIKPMWLEPMHLVLSVILVITSSIDDLLFHTEMRRSVFRETLLMLSIIVLFSELLEKDKFFIWMHVNTLFWKSLLWRTYKLQWCTNFFIFARFI